MREIVLDTETTGLDYNSGDRIIEIGCVELINHVATGNNLQFYCSTSKKINDDAFKVSGLTNDFLKKFPSFEEQANKFLNFIKNDTLITAPTGDTILRGITRDSIIQIAKDKGMKVEERPIKVTEVIESIKDGSMQEAFGAGTAATVAQIKMIHHDGTDYNLPPVEGWKYSTDFLDTLNKIKTGETPDPHNWIHKI